MLKRTCSRRSSGVELDGDRDEPEGDRAGGDGARCHGVMLTLTARLKQVRRKSPEAGVERHMRKRSQTPGSVGESARPVQTTSPIWTSTATSAIRRAPTSRFAAERKRSAVRHAVGPLRRAPARRDAHALRPAAPDRRHAEELRGAQGAEPEPADKRLAVHTEDHPLEYLDFEDVIPEGQLRRRADDRLGPSAACATSRAPPRKGIARGKIDFELSGFKLRGRFALVETRVKRRAAEPHEAAAMAAGQEDRRLLVDRARHRRTSSRAACCRGSRSRSSRARPRVAAELEARRGRARRAGARPRRRDAGADALRRWRTRDLEDPRAALRAQARRRAHRRRQARRQPWRCATATVAPALVGVSGNRARRARARAGAAGARRRDRRVRRAGPAELPAARAAHPARSARSTCCAPQAEIPVVLRGVRPACSSASAISAACRSCDAKSCSCEAGAGDGPAARARSPGGRRPAALRVLPSEQSSKAWSPSASTAPYRPGPRRSDDWVKLKCERDDDFVVVGWVTGRGGREAIGALDLASYAGDRLVYRGQVGSGLDDARSTTLLDALGAARNRRRRQPRASCRAKPGSATSCGPSSWSACASWASPTTARVLRPGVSRHSRRHRARELPRRTHDERRRATLPNALADERSFGAALTPRANGLPTRVAISNRDKVFWPDEGYTKGDLCEYYAASPT